MAPNAFRVVLGLLLATVLLVVIAPWSGQNGASVSAIAEAAEATSSEQNFRFTMSVADPETGQELLTGSGARSGDLIAINADFSLGDTAIGWTMVNDGQVFYSQTTGPGIYLRLGTSEVRDMPGLSRPLPDGKEWLRLDLSDYPDVRGQTDAFTPNRLLEDLEAVADLEEAGVEQINGVETTHYEVTIDVSKKIDRLRSEGRLIEADDFQKLVDTNGAMPTVEAHVWVGADGLVHRYTSPLDAASLGSTRIDFFDFGKPQSISVPPAGSAFDGTSILAAQVG